MCAEFAAFEILQVNMICELHQILVILKIAIKLLPSNGPETLHRRKRLKGSGLSLFMISSKGCDLKAAAARETRELDGTLHTSHFLMTTFHTLNRVFHVQQKKAFLAYFFSSYMLCSFL